VRELSYRDRYTASNVVLRSLESCLGQLTAGDPSTRLPIVAALYKWASGFEARLSGYPRAQRVWTRLRKETSRLLDLVGPRLEPFVRAEIAAWALRLLGPEFRYNAEAIAVFEGSDKRLVFHAPDCRYVAWIARENRISFAAAAEARAAGFRPCIHCLDEGRLGYSAGLMVATSDKTVATA